MARLPRFVIPRQPQHVIQRGNNRQAIFQANSDYLFYLEKLQAAAEKHHCDIHAYVLMTNHIHLLVTPHTEESIGKMMQRVGRYYVQHYNRRYERTGTLWEGRYKATLIETEDYLLTCMRYIELNPVRAKGVVAHPAKYRWSSYHSNAEGKEDILVTPHREYKRLGKNGLERQAAYRRLFRCQLSETVLNDIRETTNKGWVLGSEKFKRRISKRLDRPAASAGHGGDRKSDAYRKSINLTP